MGNCLILKKGGSLSGGDIVWGTPVTVQYTAPSNVTSYSSTLALVESTNYPFFKLTGYTRSAGSSAGNVYFTTNSTNMSSYFGDVQSYYLRGGNSAAVTETAGNTWMQTTTGGQLVLQWNRINNNFAYYYGGDNAIYINRYKCKGSEWFYTANIRAFMLA